MQLFNNTFHALENSLDYASVKNKTIANNIANVDTPNYKSKKVVFQNILDSKLGNNLQAKRTRNKHIPLNTSDIQPYQIKVTGGTSYNHNGNNVDIDKEMASLAKNQIYYQALVDRLNGKFRDIQAVIRGGN